MCFHQCVRTGTSRATADRGRDHSAAQMRAAGYPIASWSQHHDRGDFGRAVDIHSTRRDAATMSAAAAPRRTTASAEAHRRQPTCQAAKPTEHRECPNTPETGLGAAGMARPLTLKTDGRTPEGRRGETGSRRHIHAVLVGSGRERNQATRVASLRLVRTAMRSTSW